MTTVEVKRLIEKTILTNFPKATYHIQSVERTTHIPHYLISVYPNKLFNIACKHHISGADNLEEQLALLITKIKIHNDKLDKLLEVAKVILKD